MSRLLFSASPSDRLLEKRGLAFPFRGVMSTFAPSLRRNYSLFVVLIIFCGFVTTAFVFQKRMSITGITFYDDLSVMRRQLRNLIAHGAFGKDGEAFRFHSSCGAVPVRLPQRPRTNSFRFGDGLELVNHDAITLIGTFIEHLWSGPRAPARLYMQEHELPVILTMAGSGEYRAALASEQTMTQLCVHLSLLRDQYANMDF
jgi:hypothetical protein